MHTDFLQPRVRAEKVEQNGQEPPTSCQKGGKCEYWSTEGQENSAEGSLTILFLIRSAPERGLLNPSAAPARTETLLSSISIRFLMY